LTWKSVFLVTALGVLTGCGDTNAGAIGGGGHGGGDNAGGTGGVVEPPPPGEATFRIACEFGPLDLQVPIEVTVALSAPFSNSRSTEATFSAVVVFNEASVDSWIDAGITVIDISSIVITTTLTGATPTAMTSSLANAPIDNFDLTGDPDGNATPGPHRFELAPTTATANADTDARVVTFDLSFSGISIAFGDFQIPGDCVGSSLERRPLEFDVRL
jgi:hypothetical protein